MGLYCICAVCHSICSSVGPHFVSARYLQRELIEFLPNFVYALILTRFSTQLLQSYGPWLMSEFCSTQYLIDRILPNFVCALKLKRSNLGLVSVILCEFVTELWPLIDVRFSFSAHYLVNKLIGIYLTYQCMSISIQILYWYWHALIS